MHKNDFIALAFCMALSTLTGCSSPEVSADVTSTSSVPTITDTAESSEPTPTEAYVDSLISESQKESISPTPTVTVSPTPTVAVVAENKSTIIEMSTVKADAKSVSTKTTTKKTVAEKSGIKKASGSKYTNASINVRADASKDSKKLGTLSINKKVTITGKVNNGWTRIKYDGGVAYVKSTYLSDIKTKVKSSTESSSSSSSSSNSNSSSGDNSSSGRDSSIPKVKGQIAGDDEVPDSGDPTDPWK